MLSGYAIARASNFQRRAQLVIRHPNRTFACCAHSLARLVPSSVPCRQSASEVSPQAWHYFGCRSSSSATRLERWTDTRLLVARLRISVTRTLQRPASRDDAALSESCVGDQWPDTMLAVPLHRRGVWLTREGTRIHENARQISPARNRSRGRAWAGLIEACTQKTGLNDR